MKVLLALLLAVLLPLSATANTLPTEATKIEAMIGSVEQLPGAIFIRNGAEYSGVKAASHLRYKWKSAGNRVKTAEDFILFCASASSMTGKKYRIRFNDGQSIDAEQYFHAQLKRLNAGQPVSLKSPVIAKAAAAAVAAH